MTRELSKDVTDKYLSATYIKSYLECPYRFKRIFIDGLGTPPSEPLLVGSAVHWMMEELIKDGDVYSNMDMDDVKSELFDYVKDRAEKEFREIEDPWIETAVSLVLGFFTYIDGYIQSLDILAPEVYISRPIPGTDWTLQGTIDCLLSDGKIIDWKSSSRKWPPFRKYKELQPKIYRYLATSDVGYVVDDDEVKEIEIPHDDEETFIFDIFIKHKNINPNSYQLDETIKISEEEKWGIEKLAKYVADSIDAGIFPCIGAYTGAYCKGCPVRDIEECEIYGGGTDA